MTRFLALGLMYALTTYAVEISLEVDPLVIQPGELTVVRILVDGDLSELRGYTLDLYYSTEQLDLFSVNEGEVLLAHTPTYLYWQDQSLNGHGVIHVDHAILGESTGGEGPGALLYLSWEGQNCGIGDLWLENIQLRDLENQPIGFTLAGGIEQQVCQVPPLNIDRRPDNSILLTWDRVLNANLFYLQHRHDLWDTWVPLATTVDTFYVDPATPGPDMRLYRLVVDHD